MGLIKMVVEDLNLILVIYLGIGCLIGGMMTCLPTRPQHSGIYRVGLFVLLVIGWFPLAVISWLILPFIKGCSCFTRL